MARSATPATSAASTAAARSKPQVVRAAALPTKVQLRRALPSDLAALVALENASFSGDKLSPQRIRHWLHAHNAIVLVAVSGANLLGSCLVIRRADSPAARLYSIAIAAAARGQGLGGKLLKKAESVARAAGSAAMRLEVAAGNSAAIGLYQKLGYREFGRKCAYYEDGQDAVRMQKRL
jgi:ribosomal protein S18 acetylase RimI-like enzyme